MWNTVQEYYHVTPGVITNEQAENLLLRAREKGLNAHSEFYGIEKLFVLLSERPWNLTRPFNVGVCYYGNAREVPSLRKMAAIYDYNHETLQKCTFATVLGR